jgi:MSHA biogenesis protein MshM
MIKGTFGLTKEPFNLDTPELLPQQKQVLEIVKIHAQHGGFSVVMGSPGVGKSVLREHMEALDKEKNVVVVSFSRTMHSYLNILKQLAESFKIDVPVKDLEKALIQAAFGYIRDRKTLYILIDEAHLMDITVLRKLRLLFERFPKKHNLVLFGQQDLLHYLSMNVNEDIKSRITYSKNILPLSDHELERV